MTCIAPTVSEEKHHLSLSIYRLALHCLNRNVNNIIAKASQETADMGMLRSTCASEHLSTKPRMDGVKENRMVRRDSQNAAAELRNF